MNASPEAMTQKHRGYYVYRVGGKPMFAVPATSHGLRRTAWRYLPVETPVRRHFRRAIRVCGRLGLDAIFARRMDRPPLPEEFDFPGWLEQVRDRLNAEPLEAVLFWRPGGLAMTYVNLFNREGDCKAFVKLAFHPRSHLRLEEEGRQMDRLRQWNISGIRTPRLMGEGIADGHRYLLIEPLPPDAAPVRPDDLQVRDQIIPSYAGPIRRIGREELDEQAWWRRFLEKTDPQNAFRRELDRLLPDRIEVRRVHGDLSTRNMRRSQGEIWVFDWEKATETAPARSDEVWFHISLRLEECRRHPSRTIARLWRRFLLDDAAQRPAVMLVLAFLCGVDIDMGYKLIQAWPSVST